MGGPAVSLPPAIAGQGRQRQRTWVLSAHVLRIATKLAAHVRKADIREHDCRLATIEDL
jgi:hypothetical protein